MLQSVVARDYLAIMLNLLLARGFDCGHANNLLGLVVLEDCDLSKAGIGDGPDLCVVLCEILLI